MTTRSSSEPPRGDPPIKSEGDDALKQLATASRALAHQELCQTACKPGSVPSGDGDDHSSGPPVAGRFSRPTRTPRAVNPAERAPRDVPIRSCSRRGLPCRPCYQARGGLLPHPFTLPCPEGQAVCFLWRYPSGHPGRALPAASSPWSPDFPRSFAEAPERKRGEALAKQRDRPAV